MPRIEVYEQKQGIDPIQIAPQDSGLYTSAGKSFSETAQQLDATVKGFEEVRNAIDLNRASNDFNVQLGSLQAQAELDPDPNNAPIYKEKIDKAIGENLSKIGSPSLRLKAQQEFQFKGYSAYSTISTKFNKQNVEIAQDGLIKGLELDKQAYLAQKDPTIRAVIIDTANKKIDAHVAAGVLTLDGARAMRKEIDREWAVDEVIHDASLPGQADVVLDAIDSGKYPNLSDPTSRKSTRDLVESMKVKQKRDYDYGITLEQNKVGAELMTMADNGTLTLSMVNQLEGLGTIDDPRGISTATATALRRRLTKDIGAVAERDRNLGLLSDEIDALSNVSKKSEIPPETLQAMKEKILSANIDAQDGVDLLGSLDEITSASFERRALSDVQKSKGLWGFMYNAKSAGVPELKAKYIKEFNSQIKAGKSVDEAGRAAALNVDASMNIFHKAFVGKNIGDEVVLPDGQVVIFDGIDDTGSINMHPKAKK